MLHIYEIWRIGNNNPENQESNKNPSVCSNVSLEKKYKALCLNDSFDKFSKAIVNLLSYQKRVTLFLHKMLIQLSHVRKIISF